MVVRKDEIVCFPIQRFFEENTHICDYRIHPADSDTLLRYDTVGAGEVEDPELLMVEILEEGADDSVGHSARLDAGGVRPLLLSEALPTFAEFECGYNCRGLRHTDSPEP